MLARSHRNATLAATAAALLAAVAVLALCTGVALAASKHHKKHHKATSQALVHKGKVLTTSSSVTSSADVKTAAKGGSKKGGSTGGSKSTGGNKGTKGSKGSKGTTSGSKSTGGSKGTQETKGTEEAKGTEETKGTEGTEGSKGTEETKGTEGSKGTEETKGTEGTSGTWWKPAEHLTWYWQLQGTVSNSEPVEAYDIDGFETTAAEVAALHKEGKHVICYIDVGTWEEWRSDAGEFSAVSLGKSNGWPGEKYLNIASPSTFEPVMVKRFEMCKEKGFDAVEPDNMDTYEEGSKTGFTITAAEQVSYDEWVAGEVHSLGMAVLQKNDGEQTAQLEPHFDGALTEQCNQYSECSNFSAYLKAGKPVLNAEYEVATSVFCAADNSAGIMGARYDLELDGKSFEPCW